MRTRSLRAGTLAIILTLASCRPADGPFDGQARVEIVFGNATALQIVSGPHVSIVDSLFIDVTSGGGTERQTISRRLLTTDSVVQVPLTVPQGELSVDARVVSRGKTVLYRGTARGSVIGDAFSLDLAMTPQAPVLVVARDAMRLANGIDTLFIHNRGLDSLIYTTTYRPSAACNVNTCAAIVSPSAGSVRAGRSVPITVRVVGKTISDTLIVSAGTESLRIPVRSP